MKTAELKCSVNRENIGVSNNENLLYLMVEINPKVNQVINNGSGLNISMVIDKSGSMYDDGKLDNVVKAMKHVIDKMNKNDYLSVIAFAEKAEVIFESGNIGKTEKNELKNKIDILDTLDLGYQTNLAAGLKLSLNELNKNNVENGYNKIIVLTDGEVDDEEKCRKIIDKGNNNHVYLTTIGVGDEFNENFLIDIAEETGAKSYYIDNPDKIPEIFNNELDDMYNSVLSGAELNIDTAKGVTLNKITKAHPEIAAWSYEGTIKFDTLRGDEPQSVLIETLITPDKNGRFKLADVKLLSNGKVVDETEVYFNVTDNIELTKRLNPVVTQVIDKVHLYDIHTKALDKVKNGDSITAAKMFNKIISTAKLGDNKGKSDKQKRLVTKALDQLKMTKRLDKEITKKLVYGMKK